MKKLKLVILAMCVAFLGGVPIVSAGQHDAFKKPILDYVQKSIKAGITGAQIDTDIENELLGKLRDANVIWTLKPFLGRSMDTTSLKKDAIAEVNNYLPVAKKNAVEISIRKELSPMLKKIPDILDYIRNSAEFKAFKQG
eukprot:70510_1